MRVLQLPHNMASQMSITVRALRDMGVDARALAYKGVVTDNNIIETLPNSGELRSPLRSLVYHYLSAKHILPAIRWSDIVHYYFLWALPLSFDLIFARILGKKLFIEFCGSDIRVPEIEFVDNEYYVKTFGMSEYRHVESLRRSRDRQFRFAMAQATALIPSPDLLQYIQHDITRKYLRIRHRVSLPEYTPTYPDPGKKRPLIIHSPTAPVVKGSAAVEASIDQLRLTHDFEYLRVQNVPHAEARNILHRCDIFLDQFVNGAHGLAAIEAMACGKPVICYIKPAIRHLYPPGLPIIVATKETLAEKIAMLLEDGEMRRDIGQRGREYVEKYHDVEVVVRDLVSIYGR